MELKYKITIFTMLAVAIVLYILHVIGVLGFTFQALSLLLLLGAVSLARTRARQTRLDRFRPPQDIDS